MGSAEFCFAAASRVIISFVIIIMTYSLLLNFKKKRNINMFDSGDEHIQC